MTEEWPVLRIVLDRIATLDEIERSWSLMDIVRVNHALALQAAVTGMVQDADHT